MNDSSNTIPVVGEQVAHVLGKFGRYVYIILPKTLQVFDLYETEPAVSMALVAHNIEGGLLTVRYDGREVRQALDGRGTWLILHLDSLEDVPAGVYDLVMGAPA